MRSIILIALFLFSSSSFAQAYYWQAHGAGNHQGPTPQAAAQATITGNGWHSVQFCDPHSSFWVCRVVTSPGNGFNLYIYRYGDQCADPNSTYDILLGKCVSPVDPDGSVCFDESVAPPRVIQGGVCVSLNTALPQTQCKYYAGTGGVRRFWMYETPGGPPQAEAMQNKDGCEVSTAEGFKPEADCKYFPPTPAVPYFSEGVLVPGVSQPGTYKCKASTVLTGNYTPPATGSGQKPSDTICADPGSPACTLKELEKKKEQKPCTYTTDSQGNQVCVSSKFEASEGKTKCGFVGSEFKCSEALNKAVGEGISIATKVDTKPQPDGKTKITKTDVQTATSCKGSACTTKTTTTTTTTIKDGNGTTESVSGTCTGDNCPDKNGNPDGDGDGFGDCTGDDCGEGEGGGADIPFPELEEVPSFAESTTTFFDTVDNSPIPSKLRQLQAPSGGACPTFTGQTELLGPVTYDGHCAVIAGNEDLITLIAKTLWALAAVWIFFG
ncbi:hypothetical protein [Pseudomonas anguilliseptica]|uniref:TspB protein n=2 Tax=Pseudomonas anguilliseptica TaxID=53406 RepID=A0A1H5G246_PSEAG|nr:hypothetical protein [Pseudomonas anguilliseptica]SEE09098.1 hypothetical protein SAMN05421553_4012 [Pseudomonas anguilliseptica]SEE09423.1 hypothetical protein SAMN05421553_4019 [Pseudomonas anguilliseptica]